MGKEMDPVLHDTLRDGLRKCLGRHEQSRYNTDGLANSDEYWQPQKNQKEIGWDNLVRGKYIKHWRIIQHNFSKKNKDKRNHQEMKKECKQTTALPKKKKTMRTKLKTDIFQRLYDTITNIVHELWLERNTDRYNPAQGQLRIQLRIPWIGSP